VNRYIRLAYLLITNYPVCYIIPKKCDSIILLKFYFVRCRILPNLNTPIRQATGGRIGLFLVHWADCLLNPSVAVTGLWLSLKGYDIKKRK